MDFLRQRWVLPRGPNLRAETLTENQKNPKINLSFWFSDALHDGQGVNAPETHTLGVAISLCRDLQIWLCMVG